jgi:hypothetical protein
MAYLAVEKLRESSEARTAAGCADEVVVVQVMPRSRSPSEDNATESGFCLATGDFMRHIEAQREQPLIQPGNAHSPPD